MKAREHGKAGPQKRGQLYVEVYMKGELLEGVRAGGSDGRLRPGCKESTI